MPIIYMHKFTKWIKFSTIYYIKKFGFTVKIKTKEYKWNVCFYWHIMWVGGWVSVCEVLHFKDVKCAYKCSAMSF